MKDGKQKEIRYADLFGGVGGFRLGIERATNLRCLQPADAKREGNSKNTQKQRGVFNIRKSRCVFYCDSDKYAVQTYNKNFKENYEPTDIRTIKTKDIPDFDLLCSGFPCQTFSIAGKRRGFQDTRGTLFFEIARIIKAKRPKIVLLENVKGLLNHDKGKTFSVILQTISELGYDVQWMVLNSKFFGVPQNRERVFIIGSLRGTSRPEILPFREGNQEFTREADEQGCTNTLSGRSASGHNRRGNYLQQIVKGGQGNRVYSTEGTSTTIASQAGGRGAKTGLYAVQQLNPSKESGGKQPYQQNRIYDKDGLSPALPSELGGDRSHLINTVKIRRLTPVECERLQGFPENWTEKGILKGDISYISDNQRYKQMGNAVTVNVIQAIAEKLIL